MDINQYIINRIATLNTLTHLQLEKEIRISELLKIQLYLSKENIKKLTDKRSN